MSYDEEELKMDPEDGDELLDPLEEPLDFGDSEDEEDPDKDH